MINDTKLIQTTAERALRDSFQPHSDMLEDGIDHAIFHAAGVTALKEITLSANNATASENVFQITGSVKLLSIYGVITDTTTLVNLTAGYLELYDGVNHPDITLDGVVLSGLAVDTAMFKTGLAAAALNLADNVGCAVSESAADKKIFSECILTQKTGTNTYIRFTYTTTDTPINAKIFWHVRYKGLDNGTTSGTLVAV
jgi:hypothetical protein